MRMAHPAWLGALALSGLLTARPAQAQAGQTANGPDQLELSRANIQYSVRCEDDFEKALKSRDSKSSVLLLESISVLNESEKGFVEKFKNNGG